MNICFTYGLRLLAECPESGVYPIEVVFKLASFHVNTEVHDIAIPSNMKSGYKNLSFKRLAFQPFPFLCSGVFFPR
jgi:hypothetical protein